MRISGVIQRGLAAAVFATAITMAGAAGANAAPTATAGPVHALNPSMSIYNPNKGAGLAFFPPFWYQDVPDFLHDGWGMTVANDSGYDMCLGNWSGPQPQVIMWVPADHLTRTVPGGLLDFVADCAYFT